MKKIIEGTSYDTKKAILLGQAYSGFSKDDIRWSVTELYRTRSGQYFFHGVGGPGSAYAKLDDIYVNSAGEKIIPLSQDKVIAWAEEYLPNETLKVVLRDIKQESKRLNIDISTSFKMCSRRLAERLKKSKIAVAIINKESQQPHQVTYIDW